MNYMMNENDGTETNGASISSKNTREEVLENHTLTRDEVK